VSGDECPTPDRRAFLATAAVSALPLAGCLDGDGGITESPSATGTASETSPTSGESPARTTDGTRGSTDSPTPTGTPVERGTSVLVDQVGYRPGETGGGVVRTEASTCSVLDAETGETVAATSLSEPIEAPHAGETVRHATFEVSGPGEYVLATDTGAESFSFTVGEEVGGTVLAEAVRHYTLQRANAAIDDPVTGLERDAGHPQDRTAEMYFSDAFREEGEPVDIHGGWYDAGDYGKYVPSAAVTVAQLLLAYEWNPAVFEDGEFGVAEALADGNTGGTADLLAEVRYELEWLERMQRPDGAVYHKVAGLSFPALDTPPGEDTQTRYVFGLSTFGTAMYAGAMAMAARIYEPFDSAFAARMLENATDAFEYLRTDATEPAFRFDEGQDDGSGPYRKDADETERFWAAAELLKTTGDAGYHDYLVENHEGQFGATPSPISWADCGLLGQWAYYTADAGVDDRRSAVADAILTRADEIRDRVEGDGYRVALTAEEYDWGSAKITLARGILLWMADAIDPDPDYRRAARDQLHYVLGRSPTGYAYVTGAGERSPENVHDRIDRNAGIVVPGQLVGGPNDGGEDPVMEAYIEAENPPPAKAYLDDRKAYSVNEPAIDYAAPLVFSLASVVSPAGVSPR
jgi:endoglucanase